MWSVGCIFAELMLRRPFFPGENYMDQLTIICKKLGKPKLDDLDFVTTDKASPLVRRSPGQVLVDSSIGSIGARWWLVNSGERAIQRRRHARSRTRLLVLQRAVSFDTARSLPPCRRSIRIGRLVHPGTVGRSRNR